MSNDLLKNGNPYKALSSIQAVAELKHGGDLIAYALKKHGVKHVFTLIGGHISPILTGCEKLGMSVIDVRHEATAVFAADASARLSGVPGVAIVTAGPGVTNTITALKNAQMAHSPVLLFGGATALVLKGRGSLQDIDQHALMKSVVKWQITIKSLKDIPNIISEAMWRAQSDVPGPVFIEVPIDVLYPEHLVREMYGIEKVKGKSIASKFIRWYLKRQLNGIFGKANYSPDIVVKEPRIMQAATSRLMEAASLLTDAETPLIIAGSELTQNHKYLKKAIEALKSFQVPIYLSGMARGLLGSNYEYQFFHKRRDAIKEADVVLLLGVPLDFRLDYGRLFRKSTKIVSINRDPKQLKLNKDLRKIDLTVQGDPVDAIIRLYEMTHRLKGDNSYLSNETKKEKWLDSLRKRENERNKQILEMSEQTTENTNALLVCRVFDKFLPDNSILVGDGGDFIATFSYIVKPRAPLSWLDPGAFGTLGAGAGFAIGAKTVFPDKDVFLIYGDGSFGYSIAEWDTFVRHGMNVFGLIGNDARWAQIARDQEKLLGSDIATKLLPTHYEKSVEGLGAKGVLVSENEELEEKLTNGFKLMKDSPVLVNALIDPYDFRKGSLSM